MYRSPFDEETFDPAEIAGVFTETEIRDWPNVTTFLGGHVNGKGEAVPSGAAKIVLKDGELSWNLTYPDTGWYCYVPLSSLTRALDELEHAFEHDHVRWRNWKKDELAKKAKK